MSIIPNINIGLRSKRSTFNLGQDTHTTCEIGYFQPTFCREVVPDSHVKISSRNVVRLSPLAVPTMGRMSYRNYYYFVDYSTLWSQFEAFRTATNYTYPDGTTRIPSSVPYFTFQDTIKDMINRYRGSTPDDLIGLVAGIYGSIYFSENNNGLVLVDPDNDVEQTNMVLRYLGYACGDNPGAMPFVPAFIKGSDAEKIARVYQLDYDNVDEPDQVVAHFNSFDDPKKFPKVTPENADASFCVQIEGGSCLHVLLKFTGAFKRLRKILIGAGYLCNPYDFQLQNPFKLFAIYKAWYDTFGVNRETNFNNTWCHKLINALSNNYSMIGSISNWTANSYDMWMHFLGELSNICYILPPDYFSATDKEPYRFSKYASPNLSSYYQQEISPYVDYAGSDEYTQIPQTSSDDARSSIAQKMAKVLLQYVNKRSVIGRKVSDLLALEGAEDEHNFLHESVHHLGADKTQVNISEVTSLASTADASLGDYAGRGLASGNDDTYTYDSKGYGVLLCLSTIVPTSGYFQGRLKENTAMSRYDFFTQEFDALGYQPVKYDELVGDYQFAGRDIRTHSNLPYALGTGLGNYGFAPRYQHLKVGRNIVNGDISLPSAQDSMLPYTLDRHFKTRNFDGRDFKFMILPSNNPETFRKIQGDDAYGDYNRIFQYTNDDFDHFIIHQVFDVEVQSPMKSIADSFDTFDEETDTTVRQFSHE